MNHPNTRCRSRTLLQMHVRVRYLATRGGIRAADEHGRELCVVGGDRVSDGNWLEGGEVLADRCGLRPSPVERSPRTLRRSEGPHSSWETPISPARTGDIVTWS
jgi:hypothetical protein